MQQGENSFRRHAALLLCLIAAFASLVHGETFDPRLKLDSTTPSVEIVNNWLFLEGGTITGTITVSPPSAPLSYYPYPPVLYLRLLPYPISDTASASLAGGSLAIANYATISASTSLTDTAVTPVSWKAPAKVPIAIYLQYLTNHSISVRVTLSCSNPGGVQSSATAVSLTNVYATSAAADAFITCLYIFLLAREQKGRWPPKVLTVFGVIMIIKFCSVVIQLSIYVAQQRGNGAPSQLSTAADLIDVVVEIMQLGALLVLCLGYTLVRKRISTQERRIAIATFVLSTLLRFASFVCQLPYLSQNCDSFIISDTIARLGSAAVCLAFLDRLLTQLHERLSSPDAVDLKVVRLGGDEGQGEPLTRYANVDTFLRFQSFRVPVTVLLVTPVIRVIVLATLPDSESDVITALINQMTVAFIFVIVAYHFATLRAPNLKEA